MSSCESGTPAGGVPNARRPRARWGGGRRDTSNPATQYQPSGVFGPKQLRQIDRENALALLPRFST